MKALTLTYTNDLQEYRDTMKQEPELEIDLDSEGLILEARVFSHALGEFVDATDFFVSLYHSPTKPGQRLGRAIDEAWSEYRDAKSEYLKQGREFEPKD